MSAGPVRVGKLIDLAASVSVEIGPEVLLRDEAGRLAKDSAAGARIELGMNRDGQCLERAAG